MGVKSGHIFLVLREASGQTLLQAHQATVPGSGLYLDHHRTMFLAMSWVMYRRGNTAVLPCLFLNCRVLKTPSGLGGEQSLRLMNPPKWAKSWDEKHIL